MIKADELRIDNWVKVPGGFLQVDAEDILSISKGYSITTNSRDTTEPIPLTPELLIAAGWKMDLAGWYWHERGIQFLFHDHGLTCTFSSIVIPCQYLHQLQNLCYALTGTELEINL